MSEMSLEEHVWTYSELAELNATSALANNEFCVKKPFHQYEINTYFSPKYDNVFFSTIANGDFGYKIETDRFVSVLTFDEKGATAVSSNRDHIILETRIMPVSNLNQELETFFNSVVEQNLPKY